MFRLLVLLLFSAAVVAANPYVETFLSEVSVDSAHQFVEIHCQPDNQPVDLTGWQILTSNSACTLRNALQHYDQHLVVDSAALAYGLIGHGKLRLNPLGDSVVLVSGSGWVADVVHYPSSSPCHKRAPLPPSTGSVAFWNYDDNEGQSMNWYIDSTPTPGSGNDDYSEIAGSIYGADGHTFGEAVVTASGANGNCHIGLYQRRDYNVRGLGAGTYQVVAYVYANGYPLRTVFPESVTVGYDQTVDGIDFVIPPSGVAETQSASLVPQMRVSGRALLVSGDGKASVNVQLYNQVGSRVSEYSLGPFRGEKRFELPATLPPGIYFATARIGIYRSTAKVVLW